ncbi:MAG: hypothetical protein QF689_07935 [Candidatus Latescibacteria bacterium]|jgi:hypothetical protein|nr:hypothetical protein [Gemmatimonadaceae bacterium]MDP6018859.1 hypothetical protein [Candidatus Latescibacterota bacterium]MDP7448497.1 hypothetical protein [Candidatus Latescibacterota bacterium]HJP31104.1 hypothetical protein [Candidatus Latescibacterota bacterium]
MRRWLLWAEILVILAILGGIGIARFSRITPAEAREIQLEAGLMQLYEMEADHFARHGQYFAPDDPLYRAYLPWLEEYAYEARHDPTRGFSVVVYADLDGDGELGTWRVDESMPEVVHPAAD